MRFARDNPAEVAFHAFCQWLADASRGAAQQAARDAGMPIGLIADLAVGTDGGGSHAWSHQRAILPDVTVGAPPDVFSPLGQDWGLTAFSPLEMRAGGFGAFLELARAAFRHSGGVRVDHAMGLQRLWVVPRGAGPGEGAYLQYPVDDLVRLLALESHRHRAIVIGEDLGTLPEGFHGRMEKAGILGMKVLWFEQEQDGRFRAPRHWPRNATAMTTTHDLPTVVGWWQGRDITWRAELDRFPDAATAQREEARRERGPRRAVDRLPRKRRRHRRPAGPEADRRPWWMPPSPMSAAPAAPSPSCRSRMRSPCRSSRTCPARSTSIRIGAAACRRCRDAAGCADVARRLDRFARARPPRRKPERSGALAPLLKPARRAG